MSLLSMIVRCSILVDCCGTNSVNEATTDLSRYKTAYIEPQNEDICNLRSFMVNELRDMGLRIGDNPPKTPTSTDLLVRFSYCNGWNLGRYLKNINIQFMDGLSQEVVYATSYQMESNGRPHQQQPV